MAINFQPRFILDTELVEYGLPDPSQQPDIISVVETASTLIDEYCGRVDLSGNGSLIYTTYTERLLLPVGRNIVRLSYRNPVFVNATYQAALAASGAAMSSNYLWSGFQGNTPATGSGILTLSPLLSLSGRYGYGRRGQQQIYPDLQYGSNILQLAGWFGGPPQFTAIDITMVDLDPLTGEMWVPAGLYLSAYTEIVTQYNSGFDPLDLPAGIKKSCAAVVRNLLSRGGGATGLKSFRAGQISAGFDENIIDLNVQIMLRNYVTTVAI